MAKKKKSRKKKSKKNNGFSLSFDKRYVPYVLGALLILAVGALGYYGGGIGLTKETVESGNTVKVNYVGTDEDGNVFDTSYEDKAKEEGIYNEQRNYAPLEFEVGAGNMIKGFDNAVVGMSEGDTKTVTIPPEEAYGPYNENLTQEIPRDQIPEEVELSEGMQLVMQSQQGPVPVVVKSFNNETVTLDLNHPLAGKTLTFEIELVNIVESA